MLAWSCMQAELWQSRANEMLQSSSQLHLGYKQNFCHFQVARSACHQLV